MWQLVFGLAVLAGIATSLSQPCILKPIQVSSNYSFFASCFFLGISINYKRLFDLFATPFGLGNVAFSFFIGTFLWPALGLAASVLALQHGVSFAVVVGLAILAACPVGGPSAAVNASTAGGSLECTSLLSFFSAPAALVTFPYAFRHFLLLLLDQPTSGLTPSAAASEAQLRAQLSASLDTPSTALTHICYRALFVICLPLAAGGALSLKLPARLANAAQRMGPMAAAAFIVLTASAQTAGHSGDLSAAGGLVLVGLVATLHLVAWTLGFLIPAGVSSPATTCRTTAYQASMRDPALGLILVQALFGGNPDVLRIVAAPCIASICVQNVLGAWTAVLWAQRPPKTPMDDDEPPVRPRSLSASNIMRQETLCRPPTRRDQRAKED